jgi:hypothetical protein
VSRLAVIVEVQEGLSNAPSMSENEPKAKILWANASSILSIKSCSAVSYDLLSDTNVVKGPVQMLSPQFDTVICAQGWFLIPLSCFSLLSTESGDEEISSELGSQPEMCDSSK